MFFPFHGKLTLTIPCLSRTEDAIFRGHLGVVNSQYPPVMQTMSHNNMPEVLT